MATDKKFVVKNGLQAQNIDFVDTTTATPTATLTASMSAAGVLSFDSGTLEIDGANNTVNIPLLGGTLGTNGNLIQFGDSGSATDDRLQFGADQDLQIYHDGSNSYIAESGTGELRLVSTGGGIHFQDGSGNDVFEVFVAGQTHLHHNTTRRLSTTSTGIEINGSDIVFEGATADAFETTLTVTDPTADRTINIPNYSGEFAVAGSTTTVQSFLDISITNGIISGSAEGLRSTDTPTFRQLYLEDSSTGGYLRIRSTATNPETLTVVGTLEFSGKNDQGNYQNYAQILGMAEDYTDTTEDGRIALQILQDGSVVNVMDARGDTGEILLGLDTKFTSGKNLIFEGATTDANETTLTVTDPTADRTITFPDATGTVALTSDLSGYLQNVVEDTTPQLGGGLDLNGNDITGTGDISITGNFTSSKAGTPEMLIQSTAGSSQDAKLRIRGSRTTSISGDIAQIIFETNDTSTGTLGDVLASITAGKDTASTNQGQILFSTTNTNGGSPSEKLRIKSTGYTLLQGVGETSAQENTHLRVNDLTSWAQGVGGTIQLSGLHGSDGVNYVFGTIKGIKENATDNNHNGALTFATRADSVSPAAEHMRISSGGNVGINNTSPSALLEVGNGDNHTLGGTQGDTLDTLHLTYDTANTDRLVFSTQRTATGTTWVEARHRIQRRVDSTNMGYIEFGGTASGNDNTTIAFGEASTQRVVIDGDGALGINTTSPEGKLHVEPDGTNTIGLRVGRQSGAASIKASSTASAGWMIIDSNSTGNTALEYYTANDVILANGGGSVGIGTTSPLAPLDIQAAGLSSASENAHVRINDTTNMAAGVGGVIQFSGEADASSTTQYVFGTIKGIKENGTDLNYNGALTFATRANGVSPATEHMRISSGGNVGIGTNNPLTNLYIKESGASTTNATKVMLTLDHSPSTTPAAGFGSEIEFRGKNPGAGTSVYGSIAAVWEGTTTDPSGGTLQFKTDGYSGGNTTRMTIDSSGNVGIGTNSPTHRLHVQDSVNEIATFETTLTSDMAIQLKNSQGSMYFGLDGSENFGIGTDWDLNGANAKFTVTSTGNVGIGAVSPGYKLQVEGDAYVEGGLTIAPAASGYTTFELGSRAADPLPAGSGSYDFKPGMRVASFEPADGTVDGDANIPLVWTTTDTTTSSPGYLAASQTYATASWSETFTVNYVGGTRWFAKIKTNDAESGNDPRVAVNGGTEYKLQFADAAPVTGENDADAWHVIDITDDVVTGSNTIKIWLASGQKTYVLAVYVFPSTGIALPNEPYETTLYADNGIIVPDTGKVGIGTTSPSYKLQVEGGDVSFNNGGADTVLNLETDSSGTYDVKFNLGSGQNGIATEGHQIWYDNSTGDTHFNNTWTGGSIRFHTATATDKVATGTNERMTIDQNGTTTVQGVNDATLWLKGPPGTGGNDNEFRLISWGNPGTGPSQSLQQYSNGSIIHSYGETINSVASSNLDFYAGGNGQISFKSPVRISSSSSLNFEGATEDAYETTLAVADPTADRTITFPDLSGDVMTSRSLAFALGAVNAYSNPTNTTVQYDYLYEAIRLYSSSDTTIGLVFPAFEVNSQANESFDISIATFGDVASSSGLYLRIQEYDPATLPAGKTHICNDAANSNSVVQEDTRQINNWYENGSIGTAWTVRQYTYSPTSTASWASILVLNWSGHGTNKLWVKPPQIARVGSQNAASTYAFTQIFN